MAIPVEQLVPGIRGFEWMIYTDDLGRRWLMAVDADYAVSIDRGWEARGEDDTQLWPQGWLPRFVQGPEASGVMHKARIGSTTANLWTGVALNFTVNTSDADSVNCTVIRYVGERRRPSPPGV